jgi:hypothetical protein
MPLKYWNVSALPSILSYPAADLAKYHFFYDMPETCPENGLNMMNAFWFTWDHIGLGQTWVWDIHSVCPGINATYYLAPQSGTYWGEYMPTYDGWSIDDPARGPIEDWKIGRHYPYPQIPPLEGETGNVVLGDFSFGPYQPDLNLRVLGKGSDFAVKLSGDIWANLAWPRWLWMAGEEPISPYPTHYAEYRAYVDGNLVDEGKLNGKLGIYGNPYVSYPPDYSDVDWRGIDKTWNFSSSKVLLQLVLPSLATISRYTNYNMSFTLGSGDSTPPMLKGISCPLNYTPGQDLQVGFTAIDMGVGVESHFLKYSFDNGTTWHSATYQQPNYMIHCEEADSLALLINVTDKAGNSVQYLTTPASLCSKVKLSAVLDDSGNSIQGKLASLNLQGLNRLAVSLSNDQTAYAITDEKGGFTFNLPHSDTPMLYRVNFASVGLYNSESKRGRIMGDTNGDGSVDMRDIGLAATAFGSYPSHPRWNPDCDVDENDKINLKDIALICPHFGDSLWPTP